VRDINEFLKHAILQKRPRRNVYDAGDETHSNNSNNNNNDDDPITFRLNCTIRCEIKCAYKIWPNNIESLLGFLSKRILKMVRIRRVNQSMKLNVVRIEFNVTAGTYSNGVTHDTFRQACVRI